jgi:hypothetical protein
MKRMTWILKCWPAALSELPEVDKELTRRSAAWQCLAQVVVSGVIATSSAQHPRSLFPDQSTAAWGATDGMSAVEE